MRCCLSHSRRRQQVSALCLTGPRLPARRALGRAPYHPGSAVSDSFHLLQEGERVLWQQRGWGPEKQQRQSAVQRYSHADFLHVHVWYRLSERKNLLNICSARKNQLAGTHVSFACPVTQLTSSLVATSPAPHATPPLGLGAR